MKKYLLIVFVITAMQSLAQSSMVATCASRQKFDRDAHIALIDSGGISVSDTNKLYSAYDLVRALKYYDLWDSTYAIYPMIGGTAQAHSFNWKRVTRTDSTRRITWAGTVTHNSTGIVTDGSTGYGNTHMNPYQIDFLRNEIDNSNASFFFGLNYKSTTATGWDYGAVKSGVGALAAAIVGTSPDSYVAANDNSGGLTFTYRILPAFVGFSRKYGSSSTVNLYRNTTKITQTATWSVTALDASILIGGRNVNNTSINYSAITANYFVMAKGLSDVGEARLHSIITAAEARLGR